MTVTETAPICLIRPKPLLQRLAEELRGAWEQLRASPASTLRCYLAPEDVKESLPFRSFRSVAKALPTLVTHPLRFISEITSPDFLLGPRGRKFRIVFTISAVFHLALVSYMVYLVVLGPYAQYRIVTRPYQPYRTIVLAPLRYPSQVLQATNREAMTLEEIQARADRRRQEIERRQQEEREREEKARREKEEAERAAAAKAAEEKPKPTFGEINDAPIRDILGKLYELHEAGQLDLTKTNFSVMAGFKIEPDGSFSNIKLIQSSGSKIVDEKAKEILWNIGESRALGPLAELSSTTIRLDLTDDLTRLTITGFAPTADEARKLAGTLGLLFNLLRVAQKSKSPATAELLGLVKVKSDNKRIDAAMTLSRARATELMRGSLSSSN